MLLILSYTISVIVENFYEELLQEQIVQKFNIDNMTTIENKVKDKSVVSTKIDCVVSPARVSVGGIL